jgi:hypothetical protein
MQGTLMTFLMSFARAAKRRVPMVSSTLNAAGLQRNIKNTDRNIRNTEFFCLLGRSEQRLTCSTQS